jgi:hypothetical protein
MNPSNLLGTWRLTRRVRDRCSGGHGTVEGSLTLVENGAEVRWHEEGTLRWSSAEHAAAEHPVMRTYVLCEKADGWWVHFEDGRLFHPWHQGEWVEHSCNADRYAGLIRIDSPSAWRVLWLVGGPRKDQTILTRLSR